MRIIGREELIENPSYATPEARLPRIPECFSIIEKWTMSKTKFEVMKALNDVDVPCVRLKSSSLDLQWLAARPGRGPFRDW